MIAQHFRVARPTDDLDAVLRFYRDGVSMKVIARFQDHAGFDGVMLSLPGAGYHLEFTHRGPRRLSGRVPERRLGESRLSASSFGATASP